MDNQLLVITIAIALAFDFMNGFNDSAALVAPVISTRALTPRAALRLSAVGEVTGPFLFGVAVAKAIGSDLLDAASLTLPTLLAALLAAFIWNVVTWYFGIPSSSSHALVGGLVGAAIATGGLAAVHWLGLRTVVLALLLSPILGLLGGFFMTRLLYFLTRNATPRVNTLFRFLQVITSFGVALSHGANDAQKTMGVITLALVVSGKLPAFAVPLWVVLASAAAIATGTSIGGMRQIRTLGGRIFRLRPVHGLASQIGGSTVIALASLLGGPVSTTQVMSSAVLGAGAVEHLARVRWSVGQEMVTAWVLTIPATALISMGVLRLLLWGLAWLG
jgi:PiT family inorganic phosphate transporter